MVDNVGKGALGMLQSPQPTPAEEILTSLINDIAPIPGRIILVLDDYQFIGVSLVNDALAFLLEHLPPQMHLVIVTRDDPQLPLARLRARCQLTELRAADLRFSFSETTEFFNQIMDLDLSVENITALEARTEGWVAGLQLAAISMQGRDDVADLINSFAGSHRFIMDYLLEEVLEQQTERIQNFLLQTAVLDRLTGSLCETLTGQDDGQRTLEMLEHSNLFIIPLDEERRWYRYHHLFNDLLRQRLSRTQPDQVPELHHRASEWYEQNEFNDQAIEHALQAPDFKRAATLIKEIIDAAWGRGEHSKVQPWLDRLPEEILLAMPYIGIYQARYQCIGGQLDAAERTLAAAEQALDPSIGTSASNVPQGPDLLTSTDMVKLRGRVAATRALMSSYQGDVQGIISYADQALAFLPEEDLTWRSVTALILGNAHGFKGDMTAAYAARFEALKACEAAGEIYFTLIANLELVITLREQGRLHKVTEICQQQLQHAHDFGLSQTKTAGWLLAVWGETLAELNDLNGAIDRAMKGFRLTESGRDLQMLGWGFMCLIRILISRRDLTGAENIIQKMENLARESNLPPWIARQVSAWQARLWLAQGKLEAAYQWMEESGLDINRVSRVSHELNFFTLFDYLVIARILIIQKQLDEASELLQHLFEAAEAGGRISKVIEIQNLQALTYQARGETNRALSILERTFAFARPEGFVRIYVDEGQPMAHLLQIALSRGIAPEYVRRLLAAFPIVEPERTSMPTTPSEFQIPDSEIVEPLSERELEVLQLIAIGLTNREIADRLYLSLNTVKVHARNIYGKLNVHSRTQAIMRAQELGLL
jgi:LuxR family maltose regulon positive regulatory protein